MISLKVTMLLLAAYITISSGYKDCIKVTPAGIDEDWILQDGRVVYVAMHSECDNCEKDEAYTWMAGRSASEKSVCWDMNMNTKYGRYNIPFNCKYHDFSEQKCALDFSKSALKGKLSLSGSLIVTHTDNSTYFAGTICIFGKENFWWVGSTEPTLPQPTLDMLTASFEGMGFKKGNIANPKTSVMHLKQAVLKKEC